MASCRCCGRVGSRATGSDSSAPGSQRDGTRCLTARVGPQLAGTTSVLGGVDLNGAFSRARGPERRRPPRSGIAAAAPAFSFLIFFFDFGFDFTRPLGFSLGGAAGVDLNGERRCCGRVGSRATGSASIAPGSQLDGTRCLSARVDLNWLARHAFWAALTLMAPSRAREGRGGADRRALGSLRLAPAFSFLIFFFDFGLDLPDRWGSRWRLPPRCLGGAAAAAALGRERPGRL